MKDNLLELYRHFIYISENLSPTELWVVIAIAFLLLIYITYRSLGLGAVLGVCLIAFFVYILYNHQSFSIFKDSQKNDEARIQKYEKEMKKSDIFD